MQKTDNEKNHDEEFQDELSSNDYGFIISDDGELKAVYMPANGNILIPSSIKRVFKIFGIKNPDTIEIHTIH